MLKRLPGVWRKRISDGASRNAALALAAIAVLALGAACGNSDQSNIKGPIGADCLAARNGGCTSNLCLVLDTNTAYCTQPCQAQADCPDNYLCLASNEGNVCQARGAGGVCSADMDCPAGLVCDTTSSRCYIAVTRSACGACTSDKQCGTGGVCHDEGGGDTFCAPACSGAGNACPSGFICASASGASDGGTSDGGSSSGMYCLPEKEGSNPPAVGSCRGGRPLCAACSGDVECGGPGDLCVRNLISGESFCGVKCTQNSDCPSAFSCTDLSGRGSGPYQCVPNSQTCAGYCNATDAASTAAECGLGSTCNLSTHTCQRKTDGSLCAACASDDDCASHIPTSRCLVNRTAGSAFQGETFCGSDCSTGDCEETDAGTVGAGCVANPGACTAGFECVALGTGGTWPFQCAPTRGSCEGGLLGLGQSCEAHGADDCTSGICATFGSEQECTLSCTEDSQCGDARWRCCKSTDNGTQYDCSQPANGQNGICAPVGGSFGDDCSSGSPPCQNGLCLDLGTAQVCTETCGAGTTCPTGFSCEPGVIAGTSSADGGTGDSVSVCFPNGGGDVGADCSFGPAACKTHLCLKKDSGNVCTEGCTADANCPANWSCLPVDDATDDNQTTVCVPPGTTP